MPMGLSMASAWARFSPRTTQLPSVRIAANGPLYQTCHVMWARSTATNTSIIGPETAVLPCT